MNISLTPEQEKFIHKLVESGKYRAASDAVSQAVRLLQDRYMVYRLAGLQKEITLGIEASERGERFDGEEVFAELQKEITLGIEQLHRGEKVDGETAIQKLRMGHHHSVWTTMNNYTLSPQALQDISEISAYIEQNNPVGFRASTQPTKKFILSHTCLTDHVFSRFSTDSYRVTWLPPGNAGVCNPRRDNGTDERSLRTQLANLLRHFDRDQGLFGNLFAEQSLLRKH